MVALAFDPGKHMGWALVELRDDELIYSYLMGGVLEAYIGKLADRTEKSDFQLQLKVSDLINPRPSKPELEPDWVVIEGHMAL